jgi:hypothetical protein
MPLPNVDHIAKVACHQSSLVMVVWETHLPCICPLVVPGEDEKSDDYDEPAYFDDKDQVR